MMLPMEAQSMVGKVVYDLQRGVVGKVVAVHGPGEFVSTVNQKPVAAPVLVLDTGESFVATPEALAAWQVLDPAYEPFYRDVTGAVGQVVKALCLVAAKINLAPKLAFLVIGRAFQVQGGNLLKPAEGEGEGWDG